MEIVGYSERGAMNALFYGIALKKDKEAFAEFLKIIGIESSVSDVEFFMEFSLSEYGSPDLLVTFYTNKQKHILFIEAKASCGKCYKLDKALSDYKKTEECQERYDGYSSNLYYQLAMKRLFFDNLSDSISGKDILGIDGRNHNIGKNFVVRTICDKIKDCEKAHYIAIVPESEIPSQAPEYITHVFWEDLFNCPKLKPYLINTWNINSNPTNNKSQITN